MHTISCSYRAHSLKQFLTKREKFPPSRIRLTLISHVSRRDTVVMFCRVLRDSSLKRPSLAIYLAPWPSNFEVMTNTLEGNIALSRLDGLNRVEGFQIPFNAAVFTKELHGANPPGFRDKASFAEHSSQSSSGSVPYRIKSTSPAPATISSRVQADSSHRTALQR